MGTKEEIKAELEALINNKKELLALTTDNKDILKFGTKYQHWYSRAYKIVAALAPERLPEFVSYYLIDPKRKSTDAGNYVLQDYIKGMNAKTNYLNQPLWDTNNLAGIRLFNQLQILESLSSRIESVLQDVTGYLFAELQNAELVAACTAKEDKPASSRCVGRSCT